ncbi:MAG: hypothetical protein ACI92S_005463, partial [Planctomycetaceae bacterium]
RKSCCTLLAKMPPLQETTQFETRPESFYETSNPKRGMQ